MSRKEDKVVIKIQTDSDSRGADQANTKIRQIVKTAKQASASTSASFKTMASEVSKVGTAVSAVSQLIRGFGIAGIIVTAIGYIKQIRDWLNKSKDAARELGEEARKVAEQKAVDALADKYKNLTQAISEAKTALREMNELDAVNLANLRALEDAQSKLAEEKEIAAIAQADPDKDLKQTAIRQRYARERSLTGVSRKKEDVVLERQRLTMEAQAQDDAAAAQEDTLGGDDALILKTKKRLALERQRAKNKKAPEEDREKALTNADDLERRLERLETELAAKESDIAAQRRDAAFKRKQADAKGGAFDALNVEQAYADASGTRSASAAQSAVTQSAAARAEEERRLARDSAALEQRRAEKAAVERQQREAQDSAAREAEEAARAASDAEGARMTYGDRPRSRAGRETVARLDDAAAREAEEANSAARRAAAVMTQTAAALKALGQGIAQLENSVKTLSRKQNTAKGDITAGD